MHCLTKYCFSLIVLCGFAHSVIIDDIVESGHQVGDAVDCGFRGLENILGVGYQKPCRTNSDANQQFGQKNQINWNLGSQQENYVPTTPKQQGFGLWNIGQEPESVPTTPKQQNFGLWNIGHPAEPEQNERIQTNKPTYPERKEEVISTNAHKVEPTSQGTKTAPKLGPDNGRRIISARTNCPSGYAADARGRCREIM